MQFIFSLYWDISLVFLNNFVKLPALRRKQRGELLQLCSRPAPSSAQQPCRVRPTNMWLPDPFALFLPQNTQYSYNLGLFNDCSLANPELLVVYVTPARGLDTETAALTHE